MVTRLFSLIVQRPGNCESGAYPFLHLGDFSHIRRPIRTLR